MENTHFFEVNLNWNTGRKGTMSSPVLHQTIEIATPPEFPKGVEGIWSPEHLFVASVSSCMLTTFLAIAENSQLDFTGFTLQSGGKLEKVDGKWMISEIILKPVVEIVREKDRDRAERIVRKSEAACLISNSVRSKIIMDPEVKLCETIPAVISVTVED